MEGSTSDVDHAIALLSNRKIQFDVLHEDGGLYTNDNRPQVPETEIYTSDWYDREREKESDAEDYTYNPNNKPDRLEVIYIGDHDEKEATDKINKRIKKTWKKGYKQIIKSYVMDDEYVYITLR